MEFFASKVKDATGGQVQRECFLVSTDVHKFTVFYLAIYDAIHNLQRIYATPWNFFSIALEYDISLVTTNAFSCRTKRGEKKTRVSSVPWSAKTDSSAGAQRISSLSHERKIKLTGLVTHEFGPGFVCLEISSTYFLTAYTREIIYLRLSYSDSYCSSLSPTFYTTR